MRRARRHSKSRIDLHEVVQRTHEERRRHEEDTGTCYLQRDKPLAQEHPAAAPGAVIPFQRRRHVHAHALKRGQEAEKQDSGNRHRQRERQHTKIQRRVEPLRSRAGKSAGGREASARGRVQPPVPAAATSTASVNICATMRARLAPRPSRIAISRRREAERPRKRFAILAQAISSTSADERHQDGNGP